MQLEFTPDELAFRDEVRAFIAENYPAHLRAKQDAGEELAKEDFLSWHKILAKKGWSRRPGRWNTAAPAGPRPSATSGRKKAPRADTPRSSLPFGVTMVGPVIYTFGTPRAEGASSCPASCRATSGGARAIRSRAPAPTSPPCKTDAPCATATTTSSTARRPGRRWRSTPTGASSSSAPIRRRQAAGRHLVPAHRHEDAGHHRAPDHHAGRRP